MSTSTERGKQCTASSDGIRCVNFAGHPPILPGIDHNYGGLGPFTPIIPTPTVDPRPGWDETRVEMARVIARRSLCSRDRVGAVIVDVSNKVIGEGYNGPPAGFSRDPHWLGSSDIDNPCTMWCPRACRADWITNSHGEDLPSWATDERNTQLPTSDYSDCPALHAEANALMMSDRSLRAGGTIYITSHVCFTCAKLIANSGLKRVVVAVTAAHAHRNADASYDLLRKCGFQLFISDEDVL